MDGLRATLARRVVRFRLCEREASPMPGPDPIARTGVADLQERRALLHWSPEHRPRGVVERGWSWLLHRLGDAVWQDEREYHLVNEGRAWTTFHGDGGPLAEWRCGHWICWSPSGTRLAEVPRRRVIDPPDSTWPPPPV